MKKEHQKKRRRREREKSGAQDVHVEPNILYEEKTSIYIIYVFLMYRNRNIG